MTILEAVIKAANEGAFQALLDPRQPGVFVPREFKAQAALYLNFNLPRGARDLLISETQITETLSLNGFRMGCAVPFAAIYRITSHNGGIYFASGPPAPPVARPSLKLVH